MAKALVAVSTNLWDTTNGFSFNLDYAVSGTSGFNHTLLTHSLGLSFPVSESNVLADIVNTVIVDAGTRFGTTLASSDVILN